MAARGLKDADGHGEGKEAITPQAITGEKAVLAFDSLINFAERQLCSTLPPEAGRIQPSPSFMREKQIARSKLTSGFSKRAICRVFWGQWSFSPMATLSATITTVQSDGQCLGGWRETAWHGRNTPGLDATYLLPLLPPVSPSPAVSSQANSFFFLNLIFPLVKNRQQAHLSEKFIIKIQGDNMNVVDATVLRIHTHTLLHLQGFQSVHLIGTRTTPQPMPQLTGPRYTGTQLKFRNWNNPERKANLILKLRTNKLKRR